MPENQFDHDLRQLAQLGEDGAGEGWNPDRVRRAGTQRRQRRMVATGVAAALAAVTLGGGVVFSATMRSGINQPDPALTPSVVPTVTATPTRSLTQANLLRISDVGSETANDDRQMVITGPSAGRAVDASSVCLTNGLQPLGASQILSRNFNVILTGPDASDVPNDGQPIIYTQALQFRDAEAAADAYETYQAWIDNCRQTLIDRGDEPLYDPEQVTWIPVQTGTPGTEGSFYEIVYRGKGQNEGTFESVGLTLAGDRLMVTISLVVGADNNVSYEQFPDDADGMAPHDQFELVVAAAKRLTA